MLACCICQNLNRSITTPPSLSFHKLRIEDHHRRRQSQIDGHHKRQSGMEWRKRERTRGGKFRREKGKCVNQTRRKEREHEKTIGSLSLLMMEAERQVSLPCRGREQKGSGPC